MIFLFNLPQNYPPGDKSRPNTYSSVGRGRLGAASAAAPARRLHLLIEPFTLVVTACAPSPENGNGRLEGGHWEQANLPDTGNYSALRPRPLSFASFERVAE